jgi:ribosomal protein S18 acetylase RimI-like enzyme
VGDLQIVDFQPSYAEAFLRLNEEWLEKYFWVEDIDRTVLTDPQGEIIDHGGYILFAKLGDDIIGTAALKHQGDGTFELTKMAVTATQQGAGVGRALMIASIEQFESVGGKKLYLETNSSLSTAIGLYESAGFIHSVAPAASEYDRADTYMIYPKGSKSLKSNRKPPSIPARTAKPHKCAE